MTSKLCLSLCPALRIPHQQWEGNIVTIGKIIKSPWKTLRRSNRHRFEGLVISPIPKLEFTLWVGQELFFFSPFQIHIWMSDKFEYKAIWKK